jgi:hypothetical protein
LRLRPEQGDRFHRQPGLDAEERAEAAVAAVQFHVDEAAGERAHPGAAVAGDVLAVELEVDEPAHQRPRQLGALPVLVDRGQHLLVDEPPRAQEVIPLLVAELLADEEVVGRQRRAEMLIGNGRHLRSPLLVDAVDGVRDAPHRAASRPPGRGR